MGYLDNYNEVRNKFRKYLSRGQSQKILDKSKSFSRQNAINRVAAANTLRTGFQQGFNGLRNVGMQNSGEVERLKKKLAGDFTYTNDQLNKNELSALNELGAAYKSSTIRARNAAAKELEERFKAMNGSGGSSGVNIWTHRRNVTR